jgi:hypothetical protein
VQSVRTITAAVVATAALCGSAAAQPIYNIIDIGLVPGDTASQAFRISPGGVATGRSLHFTSPQSSSAFSWTQAGGYVSLPTLTTTTLARPFGVGNGVNDSGAVVGTGSTDFNGTSRVPVIWQGGVPSPLPLPAGQTLGDANAINNAGVAVGSVGAGSAQVGAIYSGGTGSMITQLTPGGAYLITAFGINNSGRVVGPGVNPSNPAVNVGYVLDTSTNTAFSVGALPGMNGALNYGVSNSGAIVGSSMFNQGAGMPFIWTDAGGMVAIPLVAGTSQGSARGVNSAGWAVGTDGGAFAVPFLYDGTNSYRLGDLIPAGSGWDLLTNTSSSAMGISDSGVIVGTGVVNGATHAYAMIPVPVPEPSAFGLVLVPAVAAAARRRWSGRGRSSAGPCSAANSVVSAT